MRVIFVTALVIMMPATLLCGPAIGMYFTYTPSQYIYEPTIGEQFDGYIYVHTWDCYLNAVEFAVDWENPSIIYTGFTIPDNWLNLGDPPNGVSITWFPPISDYVETHLLVCTIHFLSLDTCIRMGGSIVDLPVFIVPHPEGEGGGGVDVIGTCWPDNTIFEFASRPGFICPEAISVEQASWGAIKSLVE